MKFDRRWVEANAQCADGMAWGLQYVKDADKDLAAAIKGFDRADFLLWFLIKTNALFYEAAFDLLLELSAARLGDAVPLGIVSGTRAELIEARSYASAEAETLMTAGQYRMGHGLTVVAFLARMRLHILDLDFDEALKDGQCVLNSLVAARTGSLNFIKPEARQEHSALCDWLKSRVLVAGRS